MKKKNTGNLKEAEDKIDKIENNLYWVSLKMKAFAKLFCCESSNEGREFDNNELNGLGEMILDFSKTIKTARDNLEDYRLGQVRKDKIGATSEVKE